MKDQGKKNIKMQENYTKTIHTGARYLSDL